MNTSLLHYQTYGFIDGNLNKRKGIVSAFVDIELHKSFTNIFECLERKGEFIFSFMNKNVQVENISSWEETMRYPISRNYFNLFSFGFK